MTGMWCERCQSDDVLDAVAHQEWHDAQDDDAAAQEKPRVFTGSGAAAPMAANLAARALTSGTGAYDVARALRGSRSDAAPQTFSRHDLAGETSPSVDQWVRNVLDAIVEHWGVTDLEVNRVGRADVARARAERRIAEAHGPGMWNGDHTWCKSCKGSDSFSGEDLTYPCPTIRWLAYGHRYDAAGWRDEWLPPGVTADDRFADDRFRPEREFDVMAVCPYKHPELGHGCSETWGHEGDHRSAWRDGGPAPAIVWSRAEGEGGPL